MSRDAPSPVGDVLREPFTLLDGGLSTALELLGHRPSGLLWTAQLVIERPEVVVAAHRSFVDAGADVVITASYQASIDGFVRAGLDRATARRALAGTTELARRAGAAKVAASVGPFGAVLGDGSEYSGRYAASWDEVRSFHRERLAVLVESGPDLLAVETIPSRVEAEIVVDELARVGGPPAWLSFTCADAERTWAGDELGAAVAAVAGSPALFAVGVNCTAPVHVAPLLRAARTASDLPLIAYPNHGREWDAGHDRWHGPDGATGAELADRVAEWHAAGAGLVGGCCGVGPDGIAALAAARHALAARPS